MGEAGLREEVVDGGAAVQVAAAGPDRQSGRGTPDAVVRRLRDVADVVDGWR